MRRMIGAPCALGILLSVSMAYAAPSKDECLAAHMSGQDLREKGQLSAARTQLLVCAQQACPSMVSADCAKMAEELERITPTITFAARDAKGSDILEASVYVDEKLVTTKLDNGRPLEVDPGRHSVRFVFEGKETTVRVLINQGEKGRLVVGTFTELNADNGRKNEKPTPGVSPTETEAQKAPSRSIVPLILAGAGGLGVVTGLVLVGVGLSGVPNACSRSNNQCEAPAGDPVFDEASKSVGLANIGGLVAAGSGAVLVGGLLWYLLSPPPSSTSTALPQTPPAKTGLATWFDGRSGGVSLRGQF